MWGSTLTFIRKKRKEKQPKIKEKLTKGNNQLKEIRMEKEWAIRNYRSECGLAMKFCVCVVCPYERSLNLPFGSFWKILIKAVLHLRALQ